MSNVESGPLANYNSLTDPHLAAYFANARKQKHLRRAGLITRRGYIVPDRQFKVNLTRREHRAQIHAMIAQAIVQKTLDVERTRQAEVVKKMDEIARLEMMQRIAEDRERKKSGYLPMLGPGSSERGWASRPTYKRSDSSTRSRSAEGRAMSATSAPDRDDRWNRSADDSSFTQSARRKNKNRRTQSAKYPRDIDDIHLATLNQETLSKYLEVRNRYAKPTYSPYCEVPHVLLNMMPHLPAPPKRKKNPRSRASSAKNEDKTEDSLSPSKKTKPCKVTLVYHGPKIKLDSELIDPADDILIEQQMNGGNSVVVFRGRILPGEAFEFTSLRRLEFSFGLTLYINGLRDCLLSSCCEMKHRMGERLGKNGHFSILRVTDAKQCLRCMHSPVRNARKRRTKRRTPAVAVTSEEDKEFQDYEEDFDEANQTQSRGHSSDSDGGLSRSVDSRASGSARKSSQGQRTPSRASRSGSRQRSARSNRSQKSDRSQKSRSGSRDNHTESRQSNKENRAGSGSAGGSRARSGSAGGSRARSGSAGGSRASSRRSISRDELDSARKSTKDEHSVTVGLNGATLNGLAVLSGKESRAESSATGKRSPSPRSETRESGRVTALASRNSNKITESRNSERVESKNSARSDNSGRSESKNSVRSESKNSARSESKNSARSESKNSARSESKNSGKTSSDQRNGSRESGRENESRASVKIAGHHDTGSIKSGRESPSESRKSGKSSPRERNDSRTSDRSSVRSESKQNERIGSANHSASRNSGRETNLSHTSEGKGTAGQHAGSRASGSVSADGKKGLEMYEATIESSAHNLARGSRTPSAGSVRSHASQASERSEAGKLSRPASQASRTSAGSKASQKSKKSNSSGRSSAASKKSHSTLRGDEEHKLHNIKENDEISLHSNKSISDNLSKIKRDSVTESVGKEIRGSVVSGSSGVNRRAQSRNEERNSNRSSSPDSSSEDDEDRKSAVKQEIKSGSGNKGGAGSVVREGTFDNTPTPSVKGATVGGVQKEEPDSSPDSESSDDINDDDDDDSDDSKKSPKTGSAPGQAKAGETHGKVD